MQTEKLTSQSIRQTKKKEPLLALFLCYEKSRSIIIRFCRLCEQR